MDSNRSMVQSVALVFGVVYLAVGILGFIPFLGGSYTQTSSNLLGLVPINLLHNIVHLAFGVWGLVASRSWSGSKSFFTIGGIIYVVLTCVGFLSPMGFGLVPLGGADIWLHAVLAIAMLGIGLTAKPVATAPTV